jgi:predicted membrane protein
MKNKNWFWGLIFILAAIFLIAGQTGAFGEFGALSILATIFLLAISIDSLIHRSFFGVFLPIAGLYFIYQKPLGLMFISTWMLAAAAVLLSIGFSMIFGGHSHKKYNYHSKRLDGTVQTTDENNPSVQVKFDSCSKYLHGDCLQSGNFSASFADLEVFFDQTTLSPDGAEIYVDCSFGNINLYIPRSWRVAESVSANFGKVENQVRNSQPEPDSPLLTVTGTVSFGDVSIRYI